MKVLIFTPFWKRPEIVKEYVRSINRLVYMSKHQFELLAVVSPEDPQISEILRLLGHLDIKKWYCYTPNKPFGAKKTEGAKMAKFIRWDYLLELNSDSMVNPALLDFYRPFMDKKVPFWGLNNLWITDYKTKATVFLEDYNCGHSFGSGQMLHKSVFISDMWDTGADAGMDTHKINFLEGRGVKEAVVDCGATPMIVDLKTDTSIWHFGLLKRRGVEADYKLVEDVVNCTQLRRARVGA